MSSKQLLFLKVFLLIILGLSIFYLWYLWQDYLNLSQPRVFAEIDNPDLTEQLGENNSRSVKGDKIYKLDLLKDVNDQNWEGIAGNISFNLKEENKTKSDGSRSQDHFSSYISENNEISQEEDEPEPERVIPPPSFILLAVSDQEKNSRAILIDEYTGQTYITKQKDSIKEYFVRKILSDRVVLSRENQEFVLYFPND